MLIGRDAHQIEDIWQFLYRGAYWRRGPVTMSAIAAVDTALWDIKAKAAGMPLYQMLGGACRDGVRVYGHANGETIEETIAEARRYREMGYTAIRLQAGVPGLPSTYGVSRDKMFYEPADGALPDGEPLVHAASTCRQCPKLFEAARAALGWEVDLLHDVHHRLTPIEAARLGRISSRYRLFWLEDSVVAENQANFRLIRQHTTTPLAVGEIFNSIWDCKELIEGQLIDYIRTSVVHAGGITHLRRIASLADLLCRENRLSRRDRSFTRMHGRCAALRSVDSQLRAAGVHAAHAGDRCGIPACVRFLEGLSASGKRARVGRRYRRAAGGEVSVPTRLSSGESAGKTAR